MSLNMLIRHTMTPDPWTVGPDELCSEVLGAMRERGFRHAPVVEEGVLVGIVSERDLLRALPHLVGAVEAAGQEALLATVRSVMSHAPEVCDPADPTDIVARRMLVGRMGCFPVVHRGRLVGLVTTSDALRGFTDHLLAEGAEAMTLLWTPRAERRVPDLPAMASAEGLELLAYFRAETTTGALAIMLRLRGDAERRSAFAERCVEAGCLLMAGGRAAT